MELLMLGMDFPHARGEFCRKTTSPFYTLCRFSTPFVYWKDGVLVRGEPGDFLINTPGQVVYHGPIPNAEKGFSNDWLHIRSEGFDTLLDTYPLPLNQAFRVGSGCVFRGILSRLLEEFHATHTGRQTMIDCLITELVIDLHRSFAQVPHAPLAEVRSAIRQNPERDWNLAQMAAISGYSVSRFCQLYAQLYGTSPQNDVIRERLRLAKQLLASGQTSVTYVAHACGFGSINYFSKYFKKAEGCTPTQFMLSAQDASD